MRKIASVVAAILWLSCSASAQSPPSYTYNIAGKTVVMPQGFYPMGTQTWTFTGTCNGFDMVNAWPSVVRVDGFVGGPHMTPWNPTDVLLGYSQITLISGTTAGGPWKVGNDTTIDMMVTLGTGQTRAWAGSPPGYGMPFPGTNDAGPLDYLDLHGSCPAGAGQIQLQVDIAFYPVPQTPPAPPPPQTGPIQIFPMGSGVANSGTSLQIVTSADAPVGSMVALGCVSNGAFANVSGSDGANSYSLVNKSPANGAALLSSGLLGAALPANSTITISTSGSLIDGWCGAAYITGLSSAAPDQAPAGTQTNSASTAALVQANEIALGVELAYDGAANPGVINYGSSGFASVAQKDNYGADHFSAGFSYALPAAANPVAHAWTANLTASATVVATFKGQ